MEQSNTCAPTHSVGNPSFSSSLRQPKFFFQNLDRSFQAVGEFDEELEAFGCGHRAIHTECPQEFLEISETHLSDKLFRRDWCLHPDFLRGFRQAIVAVPRD